MAMKVFQAIANFLKNVPNFFFRHQHSSIPAPEYLVVQVATVSILCEAAPICHSSGEVAQSSRLLTDDKVHLPGLFLKIPVAMNDVWVGDIGQQLCLMQYVFMVTQFGSPALLQHVHLRQQDGSNRLMQGHSMVANGIPLPCGPTLILP